MVQNLALNGFSLIRVEQKTSHETEKSLNKFLEPSQRSRRLSTQITLEFKKSCLWKHRKSTPHRSETNGIDERAVRRGKERTCAVLLQSRLDEKWWAHSTECYCYQRNVQDLLADGKTPYERRFREPFKGPIIPFWPVVEYHPISLRDESRLHQIGKKVWLGIFFDMRWSRVNSEGKILRVNLEEWETMDASEILSTTSQWGRSTDLTKGRRICIPSSRCYGKIVRKRVRIPRTHSKAETNRGEWRSKKKTSRRIERQPTESKYDAEVRSDFWSIQGDLTYRHHTEPRVQLYHLLQKNYRFSRLRRNFFALMNTVISVICCGTIFSFN